MGREIKFRGKRIYNGEWVYGHYGISKLPLIGEDHFIIVDGLRPRSVIPETLGEYTGLKDRNGKEIYEGDVVKSDQFIGQVNFTNGSYCVDRISVPGYYQDLIRVCDGFQLGPCEVIGNIYENPELIDPTE